MRSPSWFKPEINANFLLTLVMLLIGGSTLYYTIVGRIDRQEMINAAQTKTDADQTKMIEDGKRERREEMAKIEASIKSVDQKADAKLELLSRDMSDVKGTMREMNANLQWIVRQQGGTPSFAIPPPTPVPR